MNVSHISDKFSDQRGDIIRLLEFDGKIMSALYITSRAGSIRANHYHKKDMHYVYLISGEFEYAEKYVDDTNGAVDKIIVKPGDLVKTDPMIMHAMRFTKDSTMVVFTTEKRDQSSYEQDTVRVTLI